MPGVGPVPREFSVVDNAGFNGFRPLVVVDQPFGHSDRIDQGDKGRVRNGDNIRLIGLGDGPGHFPGVVDILSPRQGPGPGGDLCVVGPALQDGQAAGGEIIHGVVKGDDVPLGSGSFKQVFLVSALHVLVLGDYYLRNLGVIVDLCPVVESVFPDVPHNAVPQGFDVQHPVQVGSDGGPDGKEHLRKVVPGGCHGKPPIQGNISQVGLDHIRDRPTDGR